MSNSNSGGGNFASARAFFEAAKRPENRAAATAAAKNPFVRSMVASAAKNPETQRLVADALTRQAQAAASKPLPPTPSAASSSSFPSRPAPSFKPTATVQPSTASYDLPPPPAKDYSRAATSQPVKPMYPSIMDELKSLNIGSPSPPLNNGWSSSSSPKASSPTRPPPPRASFSPSPTSEAYATVTLHANSSSSQAKFPYNGAHFDELSVSPGDRILLKREVDEQWIYGFNEKTGKFGIVPLSFLDIKIPLAPSPRATSSSFPPISTGGNMVTALYDYSSPEPSDLSFFANEQIRVTERINAEWLRGEIGTRSGIFPANFISNPNVSVPQAQSQMSSQSNYASSETVVAAYDYNSGVPDDLVFRAGDQIEVLERLAGGEWLRGRLSGRVGLVPVTYTQKMESSPAIASVANSSKFPPGTPVHPPQAVTAIADYFTAEADQLCFSRGDKLLIIEKVDQNWAKGKFADSGMKTLPPGYFPLNMVQ